MYVSLIKQFVDVFAWSYEDLNVFYLDIMHHNIPLKARSKNFKNK
jgi:hypothetical protein